VSAKPGVEQLETRNLLSQATMAVASGIVNSPEDFTNFVINEYTTLLRRAPDSNGLNHWVSLMQNGMSPEAVEAAFASSTEYVNDFGNDSNAWLNGLYHDLLGRNPDSAGFSHWQGQLAAGVSKATVAFDFATSIERESMIIRADYANFLGRAASSAEVNAWLNVFQRGATRANVEADIIASNEFFADAGNNTRTFITHIYQDVLLRTPASSEVDAWVNVFNQNSPVAR
jgi:hypothetical protein